MADRSIFRPNNECPTITCCWEDGTDSHSLKDWSIQPGPLVNMYNKQYIQEHLLPVKTIEPLHADGASIDGKEVNEICQQLYNEILQDAKQYTDCTILKNNDLQVSDKSGLVIVKSNKQPVVIKLFMEAPKTLTHPYRGRRFDMNMIFMVSGNWRYTLGFSRVQTAELTRRYLAGTEFATRVTIPRKWFWIPDNVPWIKITIHNVGQYQDHVIMLPSIYAIVCDAIEVDEDKEVPLKESFALCKSVNFMLDPNKKNFIVEKHTGKIGVIDTENFRAVMHLNRPLHTKNNHIQWYIHLAGNAFRNKFCFHKEARKQRQREQLQIYFHETLRQAQGERP